MTYGDLMRLFEQQFPGLQIEDMRPNKGPYSLYVWLKNTNNLIVTYNPETKKFIVESTNEKWAG